MLEIPTAPGPQHRFYETVVTQIYEKELSEGDSFIDLGANIGHHTWRMGEQVGASGCGFAVEPVPDFAKRVQQVLAHKKIDWVQLLNVAASDYEGECSFFVQTEHIGWSSMFADHQYPGDSSDSAEQITVKVQLLDDLIEIPSDKPLSVIKVDVENAEFAALRGCYRLLQDNRPMVIFENSPSKASIHAGYAVAEFFDFFGDLDYEIWSFHSEQVTSAAQWARSTSSYFLASPIPLEADGGIVGRYDLEDLAATFA